MYKDKCVNAIRKFDVYGPNIQFLFPDGNEQYKTCTGGFCFIFWAVIIFAYGTSTFATMYSRTNYSILKSENQSTYKDSEFNFTKIDGFAVAAGITYGDPALNKVENDPEIGQLKFVVKHWANVTQGAQFRELKSRSCTSDELLTKEG